MTDDELPEALFLRAPDVDTDDGGVGVVATPLARGPWDAGMLHGGAVCGLVGWAVEQVAPVGLQLTRLTVELWRPVGLEPVTVRTDVVRGGRRLAVVDATVSDGATTLVRATSTWVAPQSGDATTTFAGAPAVPPALPETAVDPAAGEFDYPRPGFNCDAVELRSVHGDTESPGPAVLWARVRRPVVAGTHRTPLQTVATLSDLVAAVGWDWGPDGAAMINPDVTLQLHRAPDGDWVCIDAGAHINGAAVGWCGGTLADAHGVFGHVLQSQTASPYRLVVDPPDPESR